MTPRFGLGYRPSPPEEVGLGSPKALFGAAHVPVEAYVALPTAVDQLGSNSCVGHAGAFAICAAMAKEMGMPEGAFPELPSILFLYWLARAQIGEEARDDGAFIHSLFTAASKLGIAPASAWPFSAELRRIALQPDWQAMQAAADQKLIDGAYRILSVGRDRADDIARALGQGASVVWGSQMDQAVFAMEATPDAVWPGLTGPSVGGHAMVLHAVEPWKTAERKFLSRTSWGKTFCKQGSFWVSEKAVLSHNASDFWIVRLAPGYSRAQDSAA